LQTTKIILSGGGTGGHIFPAIAIANELKKRIPNAEILFVGALGRMEMEKVPAAGFKIIGLPIAGLQRKLTLNNLLFPFKLIISLLKARRIIKEFKPHIAIGTGGYASGPVLKAAAAAGIPTLIQEQNSFAGITNKLLSKKVKKICVAYDNMGQFFPADKIVMSGNPVRQDIIDIRDKRSEALKHFGVSESKKTILVIGGSLGARTINQAILAGLHLLNSANIQLIWQTGKAFITEAKSGCAKYEHNGIKAFDFIQRMDLAYAAADIVISRAGASSVSELCITGKPSILVPSPNVAEDHQTKNAMALVKKEAAILIKDAEAQEKLITCAINLANNDAEQTTLQHNILRLAMPGATSVIADEVMYILSQQK
jgi:UDP-N-acetylglucosamine--N-acetylmuramyl-(pentapeptide) pyrophosphoryl-undecaprenol N-acetylglucosamine transferase